MMTRTITSTFHGALGLLADGAGRTAGGVARVAKLIRRRRGVDDLSRLDQRMLEDIGLTQADVYRASLTPWYADPTPDLKDARRRNCSRRWRATTSHL
ncbi:MAG: DUF1127 domain-containing protein [Pseudomonadota bacterium]